MSNSRTTVLALALAGACAYGAYAAGSYLLSDEAQGTQHAVNQIWIDHVPRDDRDMISHMVMVDHRQGKFGAVGRSSQWRHMIDVFRWQLDKGTLRVVFPQDRSRGQVGVRTWECEGEAPAPFELCMELSAKNGDTMMLYSRRDWKVEPRNAGDSIAELAEDYPELRTVAVEFDEAQVEALTELDVEFEFDAAQAEGWSDMGSSWF